MPTIVERMQRPPFEDASKEQAFLGWYRGFASKFGLDQNPDSPEHQYDYRRAYLAGATPNNEGHWPSRYKLADHPNRFVGGIDTAAPYQSNGASYPVREPDFTQVFPPRHRSPEEQRQFDALLDARKPGFFQSLGDAVNSEWISSFALRSLNRDFNFDPDYRPDIKALGEGIPDDMLNDLAHAYNANDAMRIRENLLSMAESRERLASLGTTGNVLRIGANILDPAFIAAAAATGGFGAATLKAGRLANFARAGLVASLTNASLDAYRASQDPQFTEQDVMVGAAGSFALGGAFGLWARSGLSSAAAKLQKAADLEAIRAAGGVLTPKGEAHFGVKPPVLHNTGDDPFFIALQRLDDLNPEKPLSRSDVNAVLEGTGYKAANQGWPTVDEMRAYVLQMAEKDGLGTHAKQNVVEVMDQEIAAGERAARSSEVKGTPKPPGGGPPSVGVGAATPESIRSEAPRGPREPGGFDLSGLPEPHLTPKSSGTAVRFDMAGRLGASENDMTRFIAQGLVEDPLLKKGGLPQNQAAMEWKNRRARTEAVQFYRSYLDAWKGWAKDKGIGALNLIKKVTEREKFNAEVTKATRLPRGVYTQDPHINKAADAARELFKRVGQTGKDYAVKGFDGFELRDDYVHRIWNLTKIAEYVDPSKFGEKEVVAAFRGAIARGMPDLTDQALDKWARGFYDIVRRIGTGTELDKRLAIDQPEILRNLLREAGYGDQQIEDLVDILKPRAKQEAGKISPAKQRTDLDENYVHKTADGRQFALSDLMENNIESIVHLYAHQVIGESALSEVYRAAARNAAEVIDTPAALLRRVVQWGVDNNVPTAVTNRDVAKLDVLIKSLRGQALGEHGLWYQVGKTVRGLNFLSRSGSFGIAQLPDIGQIIAHTGMRATMEQMPVLGKLLKQAATGKMDDELIDWIESVLGHGTDPLTNQVLSRFDDNGSFVHIAAGRAQQTLGHLQHFAANYSLMTPINMVLQKWAALGAIQKWVRFAESGKLPSEARLAAMGLDESMASRIIKEMKAGGVETVPGLVGRRAKRINLEQWGDQEAASAFVVALDRWSRQMVVQPSIGDMSKWMTSDVGRIIMQFRGFAAASWTRLTLSNLQHRDMAAFLSTILGMAIGGLAYMAQTYTNSIGRKDAAEYRKRGLTLNRFLKAGFQRGGASSLLPVVANEVTNAMQYDQPFNYRNSGLEADPVFGNPTFDLITSRGKGLAGLFRAPLDSTYDFSQENLRALRTFLPFQNAVGIKKALDSLGSRLPARSKEE